MNEQEVERQIDQMVRFIKQEAEEKANEIKVSSEEEFNIEKLQLVDTEKSKIKKEYERRESQIEVKKKIDQSKQLNESRIGVLQAREEALHSILKDAQNQIAALTKDKKKYKTLLTDLIVQALGKMLETEVTVRVREVDKELVKEAAEAAKSKFKDNFPGIAVPTLVIDSKSYLAPPPSGKNSDEESDSCTGGVVVTNKDGTIVCANTLDERLKIAYSQNLPDIRSILFGIEPPARA